MLIKKAIDILTYQYFLDKSKLFCLRGCVRSLFAEFGLGVCRNKISACGERAF